MEKLRKVNIRLKEIRARLTFRASYFATKEFGKFSGADKERQLEDALMLADQITDLPITMELNYFKLNSAEYFVPVTVKIPGNELVLAQRAGAEYTLIDVIAEVKNAYGATVQNLRDKVEIKLTDQTASELSKRPIISDTGFTLLPGRYAIKFLARNAETGRIGTFITRFTIPNLNNEDVRIPISSVVLSSQRIDMDDALFNASTRDKAQTANPLVREGQKLIPSVTRVFSRSREMYVFLQAYQLQTAAQPLVAFVTLYSGQAKAFETPPVAATEGPDPRSKAVSFRFSFPLDQLPIGEYNCQVTVLDPTSQKVAFWQAPVVLIP